jgi:colanic acid biosynthesis glycosyl transferase WcaI
MKIILANRYFHPDQSATSRMVSDLAFALAQRGFEVTALASQCIYDRAAATLPAREHVHGVEVVRLPTSGFGRRKLVGRAMDYATFHLSAAAWLLAHARRGDLCVVCTDPPLLSVTAALPVTLRGARLVNWVMDLFPETATELGLVSATGPAGRTSLALRDWSLRMSALTICPMQGMARYLEKHGAVGRLAIVRHWANDAEIFPVARRENRLRLEWGLQDAFVVGYSGNFGRAHEFATLIAAAEMLRDQPDIRFLMIGDGQQRDAVAAEAERRGLENMIFKPYQPSSRLAESLSAADVHMVSLLPCLEHCVVPSKFYGILAAGRPTIFVGDHRGEIATVLRETSCGRTIAPGRGDDLAALILRLRGSAEECRRMGAIARGLFESEYTLESGVTRWSDAIHHLLPPAVEPEPVPADEVTA